MPTLRVDMPPSRRLGLSQVHSIAHPSFPASNDEVL